MNRCLNQATLLPCDCETFIRTAGAAGFRQVELRSGKIEEYLCNKSYKRLVESLRTEQIQVKALNGLDFFSLVPQDNEFFLRRRAEWQLKICELFNIETLVLVPGMLSAGETGDDQIVTEAIRNLAVVIPLAARCGVRLGLEIVGNKQFSVRTVDAALRIVEGTDPRQVGLVLDAICLYEGRNEWADLEAIPAERIMMLHFNDARKREPREYRLEERLMPGKGDLELDGLIKRLKSKGYTGPVSVEVFNEEVWKRPLAEVAREAWGALDRYLA